jgi:hypothetical protein
MKYLGLLLIASPLFAQGRAPDLAGTWTLNEAKSRSNQPLPTGRKMIIVHAVNGYTLHQIDGTDSSTVLIALNGGSTTNNLPDGASIVRYVAHTVGTRADTIVYVADLTVDGQGPSGAQSGRIYLADGGRTLINLTELVTTTGDPVEAQLVFDRKR